MRFRTPVLAAVSALVLTTLAVGTAHAATVMTISASPTTLKPGETTTVTGSTSGPACADEGVTTTLTYTKPDGTLGTTSTTGVTDGAGAFTASLTLPEVAVAGEPASIQAVIADCTADGGVAESSNVVALTVDAYVGALTVTDSSGAAITDGASGDTVHVAGTTCYGGEVVVVFSDGTDEEEVTVALKPDRTFGGDYVLPDAPGGSYAFLAQCPGTDYDAYAFQLRNAETGQPQPEPVPAEPVTTLAHFTG